MSHEEASALLDATMGTLRADITNETPQSASDILDQWLDQLRDAANADALVNTMEQVKTRLKSDQFNSSELAELLNKLSEQTSEFSANMGSDGDMAIRLEGVASALRELGGQIGNGESLM